MSCKLDKLHIPPAFDRRRRVTDEMAENMIAMYRNGQSISSIAKEIGISYRAVKYHVIPGQKKEFSKYVNQYSKRYYDRAKNRERVRLHREYKKQLELSGKIPQTENN